MRADVVRELGSVWVSVGVHHPECIMVMRVRDIDNPFAIRTESGMIMACIFKCQLLHRATLGIDTKNLVDVIHHPGEGNLLSIGCPRWMSIVYIVMRQLLLVCAINMNDVDF